MFPAGMFPLNADLTCRSGPISNPHLTGFTGKNPFPAGWCGWS